jgi:hypothetical protein
MPLHILVSSTVLLYQKYLETVLKKHVTELVNHTDLHPWYWMSYGDGCYAFAVVAAYPSEFGAEYPEPGSKLEIHDPEKGLWIGSNGVVVEIDSFISDIEAQNGDSICSFIAAAHAKHMSEFLPKV